MIILGNPYQIFIMCLATLLVDLNPDYYDVIFRYSTQISTP